LGPGIVLALAVAATPPGVGFTTDPARLKADAVGELVSQLGDPKNGREAAQRLVRFGRAAVGPVVKALGSRKLQVRFYAATVLDIIGTEGGAKALLPALISAKEDPMVRAVAARAMGRADYAPATEALLRLARAHAAGGRDEEDAGDAGESTPSSRPRPKADGGSAEADVLAGNEEFRFEVIRALAYMGAGEAVEFLIAALADSSARIRRVAAEGLGDHRVLSGLGGLRAMLDDPDGAAAAAAAKAVGKMGKRGAAAIPDLISALERKDVRVRRAVMGALALTSGRSHSTPERWRRWWKERSAPKPKPGEAKAEDDFPLPAVIATEIFRRRDERGRTPGLPSRGADSGGRVPPALRKPWETRPRDETEDETEGETSAPAPRE
jgi:HEAT repeat protein